MKTTYITHAIAAIVLAVVCLITVVASETENSERDLLIIDTDAGSDDAVAIFYLLGAEMYLRDGYRGGMKIMAITCVHGHTRVDNVVQNVMRVLHEVNRMDIPVYRGAEKSLVITTPNDNYYGKDGMGDVPSFFCVHPDLLNTELAVVALLRIVDENPGQITLLTLGPLTNVAIAIRLDGGFLKKLKKLIILGGSIAGRRYIKPDFNFFMDPEAVHVVFNATDMNCNKTSLVSWEAILKTKISWGWRKNELGILDSPEVQFINAIEHIKDHGDRGDYEDHEDYEDRRYHGDSEEYYTDDEKLWRPADSIAAAVFLDQDIIVKDMEAYAITTIMTGESRGEIEVEDEREDLGSEPKASIVLAIDTQQFKNSLMRYF